jgi:hypothetical protein
MPLRDNDFRRVNIFVRLVTMLSNFYNKAGYRSAPSVNLISRQEKLRLVIAFRKGKPGYVILQRGEINSANGNA